MKRPMVIIELGQTFLKLTLSPERAKRLADLLTQGAERAEKTKENVWVGLSDESTQETQG